MFFVFCPKCCFLPHWFLFCSLTHFPMSRSQFRIASFASRYPVKTISLECFSACVFKVTSIGFCSVPVWICSALLTEFVLNYYQLFICCDLKRSSSCIAEYEDDSLSSWVNKERFQAYLLIDGFTLYEFGEIGTHIDFCFCLFCIHASVSKDPCSKQKAEAALHFWYIWTVQWNVTSTFNPPLRS